MRSNSLLIAPYINIGSAEKLDYMTIRLVGKLVGVWTVALGIAYVGAIYTSSTLTQILLGCGAFGTLGIFVIQFNNRIGSRNQSEDDGSTSTSAEQPQGSSAEIAEEQSATEPDAENESSEMKHGGSNETTPETEKQPVPADRDTSRFSAVTKLDKSILKEKQGEFQDLFQIHQDGTIDISDSDEIDVYQKMLLYTIAARYAAEEGFRESKGVLGREFKEKFVLKTGEIWLFLNKTRQFLIPGNYLNETDFNDVLKKEVEIDLKSIEEAMEWVQGSNSVYEYELDLYFGYAHSCIQNGIETCEEVEGQSINPHQNDVHRTIMFEATDALKEVQDYPVQYRRDSVWTSYVSSVDAIADYLEDDQYESIKHCLERMEQDLQNMSSKADNYDSITL